MKGIPIMKINDLTLCEREVHDSLADRTSQYRFVRSESYRHTVMRNVLGDDDADWTQAPTGVASPDEFDDLTITAANDAINHARETSAAATSERGKDAAESAPVDASAGEASTPPPGATPADWQAFAALSTRDVLPVVSDAAAKLSPDSKMKGLGKTPSLFNRQGYVTGFAKWTRHEATDADIAKWSKDRRLGVCLQTRTYRAIDVDINDEPTAHAVEAIVQGFLTEHDLRAAPIRERSDSAKRLLLVRCDGDVRKRIAKHPEHGAVELLGTGQQCVVAGRHPAGARYSWRDGLPTADNVPALTLEQLDALWLRIVTACGGAETRTAAPTQVTQRRASQVDDPAVEWLHEHGHVLGESADGKVYVACPNEASHSMDSGITQAAYFPRGLGGRDEPGFQCLHAGCSHIHGAQFLRLVGYDDRADDFEVVEKAQAELDEPAEQRHPAVLSWGEMQENPPEPRFVIPGWMPDNVVTLFAAHGGTGKSFMSLFIALCLAVGRHPFDKAATIDRARVVLYSAEDNMMVMQSRLARYVRLLGITAAELQGWLHVLDATECDNVLFTGNEKVNGRTTARFDWLAKEVQSFGAQVLIFDNASDAMDANENDRAKVRQFMSSLKRLASAVLLLAHVDAGSSMADVGDAKGYSGSTGWHNSARSRWFMARSKDSDDVVLTLPKVNYAKAGSEAVIRWSETNKVFEVVHTRQGRPKAEDSRPVLLDLFRQATDEMKLNVSRATTTSSSVFNTLKSLEGFPSGLKSADVAREVARWLQDGLVTLDSYIAANRKPAERLVLTALGREACASGANAGDFK
jgi:RecA-family ATPase